MNCLYVFAAIVAVLAASTTAADPVCKSQSLCTCETENGTIDLKTVTPTVMKTNDPTGYNEFKYSPCKKNNTSPCMDAMLCMHDFITHKAIGKSDGASFIKMDEKFAIKYPGDDNKTSSIVILKCIKENNNTLRMMNQTGDSYVFELSSPQACPTTVVTTTAAPQNTTHTTTQEQKNTTTAMNTTMSSTTSAHTKNTTSATPKTTSNSTQHNTTLHSTTPSHSNTTMTPAHGNTTHTNPPSKKTTPHTQTTPTMHTTTDGATSNFGSMTLVAIAAFMLFCRQFV